MDNDTIIRQFSQIRESIAGFKGSTEARLDALTNEFRTGMNSNNARMDSLQHQFDEFGDKFLTVDDNKRDIKIINDFIDNHREEIIILKGTGKDSNDSIFHIRKGFTDSRAMLTLVRVLVGSNILTITLSVISLIAFFSSNA